MPQTSDYGTVININYISESTAHAISVMTHAQLPGVGSPSSLLLSGSETAGKRSLH